MSEEPGAFPKHVRKHFIRLLTVVLACAVTMVVACRDAVPPTSKHITRRLLSDSALQTARLAQSVEFSIGAAIAAGKCTGQISANCTVTYSAFPADWHCATDLPFQCHPNGGFTSVTGTQPNGSGDYPAPQQATITLTLSRPVWGIVVRGGMGAVKCSGTMPTVTAYNGKDSLVSVDTFSFEFPDDCGSDDTLLVGLLIPSRTPGQ